MSKSNETTLKLVAALFAGVAISGSAGAQSTSDPLEGQPDIPQTDYPFSQPIRELIAGDWTFTVCSENFQRFSFSEDGSQMFAAPNEGFLADTPDGPIRESVVYNVLDESGRIIRMQIEDETRRTDDGRVVVWDLLLLSEDSFCWHRTDWRGGGCTRPLTRCNG